MGKSHVLKLDIQLHNSQDNIHSYSKVKCTLFSGLYLLPAKCLESGRLLPKYGKISSAHIKLPYCDSDHWSIFHSVACWQGSSPVFQIWIFPSPTLRYSRWNTRPFGCNAPAPPHTYSHSPCQCDWIEFRQHLHTH